MNYHISFNLLF